MMSWIVNVFVFIGDSYIGSIFSNIKICMSCWIYAGFYLWSICALYLLFLHTSLFPTSTMEWNSPSTQTEISKIMLLDDLDDSLKNTNIQLITKWDEIDDNSRGNSSFTHVIHFNNYYAIHQAILTVYTGYYFQSSWLTTTQSKNMVLSSLNLHFHIIMIIALFITKSKDRCYDISFHLWSILIKQV